MAESTPVNPAESGVEAQTWFVRVRNAMLARAPMGDLYVDYYLHLAKYGIRPQPEHDALFKRTLALFVLHCVSRPHNEHIAWTLNFPGPKVNLFLVGDNETGAVTGRIFDENVKEGETNLFYADVIRGREPKRRSAVTFAGADPIEAVEKFYRPKRAAPGPLLSGGRGGFRPRDRASGLRSALAAGADRRGGGEAVGKRATRAARKAHLPLALRLQSAAD